MDKYIIDGIFKPYENNEFELEITVTLLGINIKSFSKNLLMKKLVDLSDEHGIYILESNGCAYVGQSKNIQSRINSHKGKNKIDFQRCFILSKLDMDWRQYLDYMEAYTIFEMESRGYKLQNNKKPNHNNDKLNAIKKELASQWVDAFLSFLPMMGFGLFIQKDVPQTILLPAEKSISLTKVEKVIKVNNVVLNALTWKELLKKLVIEVGVQKVFSKNVLNARGSIFLTDKKYDFRVPLKLLEENSKQYYLAINASQEAIRNSINKIGKNFNLEIEFIE